MNLIALNKPFGTICQFSAHETRPSLGDWVKTPGVYAAGRLDADSEGLLLLTDDGGLQARIAEPRHKLVKRYWAQVDGAPGPADLKALARGVDLGDYVTRPCRAEFIEPPTRCGRAIRRSATAPRSRPRGSSWRSPRARTGRCAG
ncbi:ribosomal large subunit pseudouridine synthase E [Burkholderia cenocepacia]|nr:ribosomal large subunit pseudouridine synthase E [Burkholderia cenocepacia]